MEEDREAEEHPGAERDPSPSGPSNSWFLSKIGQSYRIATVGSVERTTLFRSTILGGTAGYLTFKAGKHIINDASGPMEWSSRSCKLSLEKSTVRIQITGTEVSCQSRSSCRPSVSTRSIQTIPSWAKSTLRTIPDLRK